MEEMRGQFYIGGIDLSETTDLTATAAIFLNPETQQKYTLMHYFIPEAKADAILTDEKDRLNPEHKNYREWSAAGYVTINEGNEINMEQVSQWYFELLVKYDCRPLKIGYDPWHSKSLQNELSKLFGAEVLERISMNFNSITNAMTTLESDLKYKKLNYNNCPVTSWCLSNTAVKVNNIGQIMPTKVYGKSKHRIDGTAALIAGYTALSRYKQEYLEMQKAVLNK